MNFNSFIICCQIAREIHGTQDAIRYTVRACRDRVSREHRPLLSKLMRHEKIWEWLDLYEAISMPTLSQDDNITMEI